MEALALCRNASQADALQVKYVYVKAGLICLLETRFEEAAEYIQNALRIPTGLLIDPRLFIRLWEDLRGETILRGSDSEVEVWRGIEDLIRESEKGVDAISESGPGLPFCRGLIFCPSSHDRDVPQLFATYRC